MPSSNSAADIHLRSVTQSSRNSADVGRRPSGAYTADARPSRAMVARGTAPWALPTGSRPLSSATRRPVANWHNCRSLSEERGHFELGPLVRARPGAASLVWPLASGGRRLDPANPQWHYDIEVRFRGLGSKRSWAGPDLFTVDVRALGASDDDLMWAIAKSLRASTRWLPSTGGPCPRCTVTSFSVAGTPASLRT